MIEHLIEGRIRNIADNFTVRRVLPSAKKRTVGPFLFLDHMGPVEFPPGKMADVLPHPHIGLATITYLFEGEMMHRDSIGSQSIIRPGDVNWMTAGRGIVHSERATDAARKNPMRVHGLQIWVGLPAALEESDPTFQHAPADALPLLTRGRAKIRILAGSLFGAASPVRILSPLFYADVELPAGESIALSDEIGECAVYVIQGRIICGKTTVESYVMGVFQTGVDRELRAQGDARFVLIGGELLDGHRHMDWNFVSSSLPRIEKAKADWKAQKFPRIPGDDVEFVPLPEPRRTPA